MHFYATKTNKKLANRNQFVENEISGGFDFYGNLLRKTHLNTIFKEKLEDTI